MNYKKKKKKKAQKFVSVRDRALDERILQVKNVKCLPKLSDCQESNDAKTVLTTSNQGTQGQRSF